HFKDRVQTIRGRLVWTYYPEVARVLVELHYIAKVSAKYASCFSHYLAGAIEFEGVLSKIGKHQLPEQQPAVCVRVGAHSSSAVWRKLCDLLDQLAVLVEQFFGLVAAHPLFEHPEMVGAPRQFPERNLVRAK